MRLETDSLGTVELPGRALYGAQTQRAITNFPPGDQKTIGDYPIMIRALVAIKQVAAAVNAAIGCLPETKAEAIIKAAERVRAEKHFDQFPVHFLHGGGGTSANMNVNEVLANMAEEYLGGTRGAYQLVHPHDHVNLHQSTNDVYPSACHAAIILAWPTLKDALNGLADVLAARSRELGHQKRIARTCLQDAVDITFGDLLGGYAAVVTRSMTRGGAAIDQLHTVNLGGTIVGRAEDAPPAYRQQIVSRLGETLDDPAYRQSENLFDAAQNVDDLAAVSSQLALLARSLIKIAQDFRLMGSGPEAGFNEIVLPPVQPGSSIMPAKVNPVIPEFVIQCAFQTIGADAACQAALAHGELDLNVWESTLVFNILDSIDLLATAVKAFAEKCVAGFQVSGDRNDANVETMIPLVTRLMHKHGYSAISAICKEAAGDVKRLGQLLRERGFLE